MFLMKPAPATRTVAVRVDLTSDQKQLLQRSVNDYNRSWKIVSEWCATNKSVNRTRLHEALYRRLRNEFPELPSQFSTTVLRHASGTMKTWNKNNPKKRWRKDMVRKQRTLPVDLRTMSLRGNLLTISTRVGQPRIRTLITIPEWFQERYPQAKVNAATIHLDRKGGPVINLVFRIGDPTPSTGTEIVGIDRGIYTLAVSSKGDSYSGSQVRAIQRKYQFNRKTLQQKGTRSAKRRLKAMSGREERFMRDVNHQISKRMANDQEVRTYVLEDLTGVRKAPSRKGKGRSWLNKWAFRQLGFCIEYKSLAAGKEVFYVDPRYTSQQCNRCGMIDKKNRDRSRFSCLRCGFQENADLNASRNIRDRYLLSVIEDGAG